MKFVKLIPYLGDVVAVSPNIRKRNFLSWALAGTGCVLFTRQVAMMRQTLSRWINIIPYFV